MRGIAMAIICVALSIGRRLRHLDPKLKPLTDREEASLSAFKAVWFIATLIVIAAGW